MKKNLFLVLSLFVLPLFCLGQTVQQLEEAIKIYNGVKDTAKTEGISLIYIHQQLDQSESLLKKVLQNGTPEEIRAAKYFSALTALVRGETYYRGSKAEKDLTLPTFLSVESDFDRLGPSEFPIRYSFFGKNYKVEYSNFEYSRMKYYAELAEIYAGVDNVKMQKFGRKSLEVNAPDSDFLQFLVYYFFEKNTKVDADRIEAAQKFIPIYNKMNAQDRKILDDQGNGLKLLKRKAEILLLPTNQSWDKTGELSAQKARDLLQIGNADSLACRFYDQAVSKNYSFYETEKIQVLDLYDRMGFKSAGLKFCNQLLVRQSASNCDGYDLLAKYYLKFGDNLKSKSMAQTAEKCRKDAAAAAQAEARRREKAARKANRNRAYLGLYVLRVVQRPQYIDLGGYLDLPVGDKTMMEFSFMKARNDQDYLTMERLSNKEGVDDINNPHWDGFYGHIGFKWTKGSRKSKTYTSMLFTYNQRDFQPQFSDVSLKNIPLPVEYQVAFEPKMTSYGVMFNSGALTLGKPFGIDMYMGLGPTYNIFKLNNDQYSRADYDFSNPFLQQRKEQFWGFQIRFGVTVGLVL